MDEKKLRAVIKTCMALTILILAYFVPRIAFREQLGSETNQAPAAETGSSETALTETEQVEPKIKGQRGLIILDPGHGGMDPGMIGVGGIEEKLINLQVSLVLAEKLEEQGFETMLTRTEDRGLYDPETVNKKAQDMQRRCALIEENDPLLTVSIHQNSYSDPAVYGPQVFYFEHSATPGDKRKHQLLYLETICQCDGACGVRVSLQSGGGGKDSDRRVSERCGNGYL